MQSFHLSFEHSAWWLLPILLISASLAWLSYSGQNVWVGRLKWVLGALRFVSLLILLTLLQNPHFRIVHSYKEKPVFPIVVDNSQSVQLAGQNPKELQKYLSELQGKLEENGFDAPLVAFDGTYKQADSITLGYGGSDLAKLLAQTEKTLAHAKGSQMLLISDGIFNTGTSPAFQSYKPSVFTLGLGDTVPRKDLILKSLQNNSVAFLGNKFTLRAEVRAIGYGNKASKVVLRDSKNNVIDQQPLTITSDHWHGQIDFQVPANAKGYQRYTVQITTLPQESNRLNNALTTYVDVVDDRENVLLVAKAPHPNIKAIRAAMAKLENVRLEVYIPGISEPKAEAYDLVILHDCFLSDLGAYTKLVKENTSNFYIAGSTTDVRKLNAENGIVEISNQGQTDLVQAALSSTFSKFKLSEDLPTLLAKLPPVEVLFGEIKPKAGTEVLLYQQISSVQSAKPLLLFGQGTRKTGVFLSDGIWQWRMNESLNNDNTLLFDEFFNKIVQYLSSKEDKRKFRIYPHQKEYFEGEEPKIEVEIYNNLYEKVYGQKVNFKIPSLAKNKAFDFVPTEGQTAYTPPPLAAGVHKISAEVQHGGQTHAATTEFIVKERQLEAMDLQANHEVLRQVAQKTKASFYAWNNRSRLLDELSKLEAKAIWKSDEKTEELIDLTWFFFIPFALLASEWIIRRYTGGY
jgi:hypothetical protein